MSLNVSPFSSPFRSSGAPSGSPLSPRKLLFGEVASPMGFGLGSSPGSPSSQPLPMKTGLPRPNFSPDFNTSVLGRGYNPLIQVTDFGIDPSIPGFNANLENLAKINIAFRLVLYTSEKNQIVLMSLNRGENIGSEVHPLTEQFFKVEDGQGYAVVNGKRINLEPGTGIAIPAGIEHDIVSTQGLKLYTIYTPPHHPYDRVDQTKGEALAAGH